MEADEGPFARVTSMSDLDEERRRLGGEKRIEVDKEKGDRRKTGLGGVGKVCKAGCMVM